MTYLLPLIFLAAIAGLLVAMPWTRPQPNAIYIVELLNAAIGEDRWSFPPNRRHHVHEEVLKHRAA